MALKGSKYARKHKVVETQKKKDIFNETFFDVIYDNHTFLDVFHSLELSDQLKSYQILKKLAETSVNNTNKSEKKLILESRNKLDRIHESAGLKMEEMLRYPLSSDEHHIIRMDCYGSIDKRPTHQLSSYYKEIMKAPYHKTVMPDDYKLEDAPMWKVFRQFENFRNIEPNLKQYLYQNKINPEILNYMSVKDFSDLIYKAFQKEDELKVVFVDKDSSRNAFVKRMANNYHDAIFDILKSQECDERYIHSLLNAMKMYGVTDSSHITITETHFTPKVLTDLEKAKIKLNDYNVGDEIPQNLVEYLARNNQIYLLVARDENLTPLKGSDFPSSEVHHKVAVSESGKLPCLAQVNYLGNYLLVDSNIHQIVLHGFDKLIVQEGKEAYNSRMEFVDKHLAFMAGFTPDKQLSVNWHIFDDYEKKLKEDMKHIVSYDDCLNELKEKRIHYLRTEKAMSEHDVDIIAKTLRDRYSTGKINKTSISHKTRKNYLKKLKGLEK